jgi:hypothetical protein
VGCATSRLPCVIPWIIFAVIAVPLVVIGFAMTRRKADAGDLRPSDDVATEVRAKEEFADAEAYQAQWHEEDKAKYHQERLP